MLAERGEHPPSVSVRHQEFLGHKLLVLEDLDFVKCDEGGHLGIRLGVPEAVITEHAIVVEFFEPIDILVVESFVLIDAVDDRPGCDALGGGFDIEDIAGFHFVVRGASIDAEPCFDELVPGEYGADVLLVNDHQMGFGWAMGHTPSIGRTEAKLWSARKSLKNTQLWGIDTILMRFSSFRWCWWWKVRR